jgi:hypothetical protein
VSISQQLQDEAETNDEDNQSGVGGGMCTNGRDLYKKFEDLIAKDYIRIGGANSTNVS